MEIEGVAFDGSKQMGDRMGRHKEAFEEVLGISLFVGSLNVKVTRHYPIRWSKVLRGDAIEEPEDFLFEPCQVNGIPAFRIRPYHPANGSGGHGDNKLEFVASERLRRQEGVLDESVTIEFYYDI